MVVALFLGVVTPVAVSNSLFNDYAVLDVSQANFHQGMWMCPEGLADDEDNCTVEFVPVIKTRPDWDHAMEACLREYSSNECYNSVNNGEF